MQHSKGGVFALALALLFSIPGCHSASPEPAGLSGKEVIPARSETPAEPPLSESEMIAILQQLHMPEARVLGIRMSPVKGLWEADVENKRQRFVVYVDASKKYIMPGHLIEYATHKDITKERIDELNKDRKVDVSRLPLQDALIVGKDVAPIRIIVFTDPG